MSNIPKVGDRYAEIGTGRLYRVTRVFASVADNSMWISLLCVEGKVKDRDGISIPLAGLGKMYDKEESPAEAAKRMLTEIY